MVLFKKTKNNRRICLAIIFMIACLLYGLIEGERAVLYLFVRYRFNWNEMQFSFFQTFNFAATIVGTIFSTVVLSKYLKWHDSLLGIVSTTSKITSSFVYCFAPNVQIFCVAPVVDILSTTSMLVIRSISSKLVESNEIGKLNSIVGLIEVLMPIMFVPMFTRLYTATMDALPGAVFLLGGALTLPVAFVFTWLYSRHRKEVHT
ncbi:uncharacterized protein LOC101736655 [Bombyx mori]|uniref:Adenylate cyclase n=1 Tax=Bombyx mori TaxID=7091 RepID=A0A8R2HMW2_BOMMO|nr:uncharacterized protein LOC101736655 [Bombyx mori]